MVMGREDNVKLARDGGAIRGKKKKKTIPMPRALRE